MLADVRAQFGGAPDSDVWRDVDGGNLCCQAIKVREIDPVGSARAVSV